MFHIEDFLKHLKEKLYSFSTLHAYLADLEHFEAYCFCCGIEDVRNISKQVINEYFKTLNGNDRYTKAYCNHITRIIKYFRYLEEEGIIFLSPLRDYFLPKYKAKSHPVLGITEMERIFQNTTRTTDPLCIKGKAIIELAYSSALRPRELYELKIPNIDFEHGLLFIEQSKNKKDRIVPVGSKALAWTKQYIQDVRARYIKDKNHGYVFINHKSGERLTVWGVRWAIQETLRRNGLRPIKTYSLRGTAATHLLANGMNIVHISRFLGHSRIQTTQYYLKVSLKQLQQEIKVKHPRNKIEEIFINQGGNL